MSGDQNSIALFFAVIIIFVLLLPIGLLKAVCDQPWLLIPIALAVVIYFLARRAERRERGQLR